MLTAVDAQVERVSRVIAGGAVKADKLAQMSKRLNVIKQFE